MSVYIDRDELIKDLEHRLILTTLDVKHPMTYGQTDIVDIIRAMPAADVRPAVKGKWLKTSAYPHRLYCSECYDTYLRNAEWLEEYDFPKNFCPNCNADMREEARA